ncbi:tetraacyldisaccharide 4'-kinase [Magnetovibrio sp.]|uniref:tetraacyldisaccharide 4'-kinase n=1 Tax=Magnetovibrio sp. TaxID=2024836 RepID=UPI002F95A673
MRAPDFWDRKTDGVMPSLLRPLGCLVAGVGSMRRKAAAPWRAPVPVICIGNLVVGGAGKTPVAIDIVTRLKNQGVNAHVVSRGYGGSELGPVQVDPINHDSRTVGDEPLLLARSAPTWVSRDRRKGIEAAVAAGAQIVVMDDGYQNPNVEKDLSLLVVDGGYGFGNARVMPAGPLREPVDAGLARADAVVLLGADEADVWGRIQRLGYKSLKVLRAKLEPIGDFSDLKNQKVFAFAGIGRPEKFFKTLEGIGCKLAGCRAFDDHHPYSEAEVLSILADAVDMQVLTTAKDHVRLSAKQKDRVRVLDIGMRWKNADEIDLLLAPFVAALHAPQSSQQPPVETSLDG